MTVHVNKDVPMQEAPVDIIPAPVEKPSVDPEYSNIAADAETDVRPQAVAAPTEPATDAVGTAEPATDKLGE